MKVITERNQINSRCSCQDKSRMIISQQFLSLHNLICCVLEVCQILKLGSAISVS